MVLVVVMFMEMIFFITNAVTGAEEIAINRDDFPSDFLFGAATSALQIEGSASKGGKGASIWDNFVKFSGKVKDGSNITTAIDSYNRYKEDVKILKELGVDSYRFSISWTRILPSIKPLVTKFHFDSPQALQDKDDFVDYCEVCFLSFGDRVKHWITINEPHIIAMFGHDFGRAPPGRCSAPMGNCSAGNSATEPYIVSHNILLAHATAARLYKENFQVKQGGEIGIALVGQHSEPYSESPEDIEATERSLDFYIGWYLDPLVNGDYPSIMRKLVKERLPIFTEEEGNG